LSPADTLGVLVVAAAEEPSSRSIADSAPVRLLYRVSGSLALK
jgi:hypothetical protein